VSTQHDLISYSQAFSAYVTSLVTRVTRVTLERALFYPFAPASLHPTLPPHKCGPFPVISCPGVISFPSQYLISNLRFLSFLKAHKQTMGGDSIWGSKDFQVPDYFNFADVLDEWAHKEKVRSVFFYPLICLLPAS